MAILDILHYPDPRLRNKALPVAQVDAKIRKLVADMFATMYEAPGIGLAATQVNVARRVVVIDISEDHSEPMTLINPEIIASDGEEETQEGCLSVPGYYDKVTRAEHVVVKALNEQGEAIEYDLHGLLAVCVQHEIDHLDGLLFIDRVISRHTDLFTRKVYKKTLTSAASNEAACSSKVA